MAEIDQTIALKGIDPVQHLGRATETIGNLQQVKQRALKMQGLADYGAALDAGEPPETAVRHLLRVDPEMGIKALESVQKHRDTQKLKDFGENGNLTGLRGASPELGAVAATSEGRKNEVTGEERARTAHSIMNEPDPQRKLKMWQDAGDDWEKRGMIPPHINWKQIRDTPNDLILNNIIKGGMGVAANRETTGAAAAATAAGTAPFKPEVTQPGASVTYPAIAPGGPMEGAPPAPPIGSIAPIVPRSVPTQRILPAAKADEANTDPYYTGAPSFPVAPPVRTGPGVVDPGQHPIAKVAAEKAMKTGDEIQSTAVAAQKTKASLNTMESELEGKKVGTNRLAELRLTVAGFINGVLQEPDGKTASAITGINLPWGEAFNKESTRMGLQYARQTEGAREAVQAIRIALAANPSILNTEAGNLKIIKVMKAAADYDIERSKAAAQYYKKQADTTGTGHLENFDTWFANNHSPSQFISKAVPYQLPPDPSELKDRTTYEFKDGKKGTYNAQTQQFDLVK